MTGELHIFNILLNTFKYMKLNSIRGFLGLTMALASNSGILIAFLTGNYCDYYTIPKVALVLSALFSTIFPFFPESPSFLFKQNRISVRNKYN